MRPCNEENDRLEERWGKYLHMPAQRYVQKERKCLNQEWVCVCVRERERESDWEWEKGGEERLSHNIISSS